MTGAYVIGSGPAGVSVAASLLQQQIPVTMLDAGISLEPDRHAAVQRLRQVPHHTWTAGDLAFLKDGMVPSARGVARKMVYGSDFPYRGVEPFVALQQDGVESAISFARGGLSNVWGSAIMPYHDRDLDAWPVRAEALAPHYRAVLQMMPMSAAHDDLSELFPLYADHVSSVGMSRQARHLLQDLTHRRARAQQHGLFFGQSRIALQAQRPNGERACVQCGLCMYGCPHELIYNSSATVTSLLQQPGFAYVSGVVVDRVEERSGQVKIHTRNMHGEIGETIMADRVYLGCGPVSTTRILMTSQEMYDTPVTLLDSQYFLLPFLRYRGVSGVRREPLHTLAQVFLELIDEAVSSRTIHLQVYTYNDLYDTALQNMAGPIARWLHRPLEQVVSRLLVIQGYLHSDESPRCEVRLLRPNAPKARHTLRMTAVSPAKPVAQTLKRVVRKLWSSRNTLRGVPVSPLLTITAPGRGFHTGGSFPMSSKASRPQQSDILGRPVGFERVHCVDSTVFPSIPATTITLTVMANAHRIGAHYHDT